MKTTTALRVVKRWICFQVITIACSFLIPRAFGQEGTPIKNLGAISAAIEGDWLVYSVWESFEGQDLNGDGDTEDTVVHVQNLASGKNMNLALASESDPEALFVVGDWVVFPVGEWCHGKDLNGDGDAGDRVLHVHDLSSSETTNLGLAINFSFEEWYHFHPLILGNRLVFGVWEIDHGEDLNRDGDTQDDVLHVHDLSSGETTNLGLAVSNSSRFSPSLFSGDRVAFRIVERNHGEDLNGDGDTNDEVLHVHDLSSGVTTNLRFAAALWDEESASVSGDWAVFRAFELGQAQDLDGDGEVRGMVAHVHNLATGQTVNLGAAVSPLSVSGNWVVFVTRDSFLRIHDLSSGETMDLLPVVVYGEFFPSVSGDWVVFQVSERDRGTDLNGDGDAEDWSIIHVHDLASGRTENLGLGWNSEITFPAVNLPRILSRNRLVLDVSESFQGEDLNGDGDTEDNVVHVHDLSSNETVNLGVAGPGFSYSYRLSGDWLVFGVLGPPRSAGEKPNGQGGGDLTLNVHFHVLNLSSGEITNLGLAYRADNDEDDEFRDLELNPIVSGDWLLLGVTESLQGEDLNGDGNVYPHHRVFHLVDLSQLDEIRAFTRGDANADSRRNVTDAVFVLTHLFSGGEAPPCAKSADINDSGTVDVADPVFLLTALFAGGASIPAPFPDCGPDPTPDDLGCAAFDACQ